MLELVFEMLAHIQGLSSCIHASTESSLFVIKLRVHHDDNSVVEGSFKDFCAWDNKEIRR